ncbi:MAG: hypothetical protein KAU14_07780 [Thermoplasmata archaeon]|nr:hypothetical protein [Thermoplasmata archaeon]
MGRRRNAYWDDKNNRVKAIKELVKSADKPLRKITKRDFFDRKLGTLLNIYKGSPKRALIDAGFDPGPLKHPKGYWNIKEHRIEAIHKMLEITGKEPTKLRKLDFISTGYSLLVKNRTMEELLSEAGLPFIRYQRNPGYWKNKENRIREVRALVEKLDKDPSSITKNDFTEHGLSTVLNTHRGSLRAIMKEAGYHVVKKKPPKYWNIKENRVNAIRNLVRKLNKKPSDIRRDDFVKAGLQSLLLKYRDEVAAEYEKGDIITYDKGYLLKYRTKLERALAEAGLIGK